MSDFESNICINKNQILPYESLHGSPRKIKYLRYESRYSMDNFTKEKKKLNICTWMGTYDRKPSRQLFSCVVNKIQAPVAEISSTVVIRQPSEGEQPSQSSVDKGKGKAVEDLVQ